MEVLYREQEFVERCFCGENGTRPCRCCGRLRCEAHLEHSLCNRCTQFVERELSRRSGRAWAIGGTVGAITTFGLIIANVIGAVLIGIPAALVTGWAYRRVDRARTIRAIGPAMSASKGELPGGREADYSADFSNGNDIKYPPYGA